MAAPKTNRAKDKHPKTIEKISSTQLVNALMDHVLERNGRGEMKSTQVTAALGLLRKTIPDLSATTLEANVSATVTLESKSHDELDSRIDELTSK